MADTPQDAELAASSEAELVSREDQEFIDEVMTTDVLRGALLQPPDAYEPPADGSAAARSIPRSVAEGDARGTLDTTTPLPLIDVHCHVMGLSTSQTTKSLKEHPEGRGHGQKLKQKTVKPWRKGGLLRFGYYNFDSDEVLAQKLLASTKHFAMQISRAVKVVVAPMLLDFGYTPLLPGPVSGKAAYARGNNKKRAESEELQPADGEDLYYTKGRWDDRKFIWYPRDTASFQHTIQTLSNIAKAAPGEVWPFAPFDPRRPDGLAHVQRAINEQGYVGVKIYSRCGWMPYENRKIYGAVLGAKLDARLDAFYQYLLANDLPLMVHCSPTGYPPETATGIAMPFRLTNKAILQEESHNELKAALGDLTPPCLWASAERGHVSFDNAVRNAACTLANYCLYNQLTTSPYGWDAVLEKYPALRLCFGHCGSKLAVYASNAYNVTDANARADIESDLAQNPMAAPADGPRSFRPLFREGVRLIARSMYHTSAHRKFDEKILRAYDEFMQREQWQTWFGAWEAAYPEDWTTRINQHVSTYENVYTDLSFVTGDAASFNAIVGPLVEDALGMRRGRWRFKDKLIIGTDWFMTELQGLSPRGFWNLLYDCILPNRFADPEEYRKRQIVWDLWSSKNTLRYLNLQPRLNGTGMDVLEQFYGERQAKLMREGTPWSRGLTTWTKIKRFYTSGEYRRVPDFAPVPPPRTAAVRERAARVATDQAEAAAVPDDVIARGEAAQQRRVVGNVPEDIISRGDAARRRRGGGPPTE